MQIMHKRRTIGRKQTGKVLRSKYVCNAAGTGTEADQSVETIFGA